MKRAIARAVEPHFGKLTNLNTRFINEELFCNLLGGTGRTSSRHGGGHWASNNSKKQ